MFRVFVDDLPDRGMLRPKGCESGPKLLGVAVGDLQVQVVLFPESLELLADLATLSPEAFEFSKPFLKPASLLDPMTGRLFEQAEARFQGHRAGLSLGATTRQLGVLPLESFDLDPQLFVPTMSEVAFAIEPRRELACEGLPFGHPAGL
jgi:hypothetical protein